MTWPFTSRVFGMTATDMVAERTGLRSGGTIRRVSRDQALRNSAVWACLRLRADLLSTMPLDVYRDVNGVRVEQKKPPVLVMPGGKKDRLMSWLDASQFDLDSCGNTFGIIRAFDGVGIPSLIELVNADSVTVVKTAGVITYRIDGVTWPEERIWHERQFPVAGSCVGLSPIAYAAMSLGNGLSAGEFAASWFANNATPGGHLKNVAKTLKRNEAARVKENFKASITAGDVWVSGSDWEYSMISAKASEAGFLEQIQASTADVCRFLGVPGDMIDVSNGTTKPSITYANITQRNLQFLIMHLGPAIARREEAISFGLLPQPRYVKFNTGALLRMDLKSRYDSYKVAIDGRWMTPSEARAYEDSPPLTPDQEAEFGRLFPAGPSATPTTPTTTTPGGTE